MFTGAYAWTGYDPGGASVKSSGLCRSSADAGMNWTPGICFSKRKGNFFSKTEALDSDISNNENHPFPYNIPVTMARTLQMKAVFGKNRVIMIRIIQGRDAVGTLTPIMYAFCMAELTVISPRTERANGTNPFTVLLLDGENSSDSSSTCESPVMDDSSSDRCRNLTVPIPLSSPLQGNTIRTALREKSITFSW